MPKRFNNNSILIISDTHAPYHHKGTLDFLADISNFYQPDRVIHLGDLADIYGVSDYPKDLEHPDTWKDEIKGLRKFTKQLGYLFPKMELMSSNHDDRPYKKSRVAGIPRELLVKYLDVIDAPAGWTLYDSLRIRVEKTKEHWLFAHTIGGGSLLSAQTLGYSVATGHTHTKFGCTAFNNGEKLVWGVDAGCFISDSGSPFKYNKNQMARPIRGCCIILDGTPHMIPMGV